MGVAGHSSIQKNYSFKLLHTGGVKTPLFDFIPFLHLAVEGRKMTHASFIYALVQRCPVHICPKKGRPRPVTGPIKTQLSTARHWAAPIEQPQDIFTAAAEGSLPLPSAMIEILSEMWHCRVLSPEDCRVSHWGINWRVFGWRMWEMAVWQRWFESECCRKWQQGWEKRSF